MAGSPIVSKLYDDDVLYEMICSAQKESDTTTEKVVLKIILGRIIYQFQGNSSIFNC